MPKTWQVVVIIADSGLPRRECSDCIRSLGWHYGLGITSSVNVTLDQITMPVGRIHLVKGELK